VVCTFVTKPAQAPQRVIIDSVLLLQGSSRGRGTRAAGWFEDHAREKGKEAMGSYTLLEGIAGWEAAGSEYTGLMDEYQKEHWRK